MKMSFIKVKNNPKIYFWANLLGGVSFIAPVFTLFYLHRGLVYSDIFVLLSIIVVSMFLFEVPTGIFADKYGSKASLITGQILSILIGILFIFAWDRWMFYFISALTGLAVTFFSGCDEAFIYDSLKELRKEKQMSKIWGKISSATFLPSIIGVVAGSFLAKDLLEWQFVLLLLLGLIFSVSKLVILFFLKNPKSHYTKLKRKNPFHHVKKGWNILKKNKSLLILFMNETLVLIPIHVFNKFDQPFFLDNGILVATIGLIYAVNAIISFFVLQNIEWFEKKLSRKKIVIVSGIAVLLGYICAAFINSWIAAIVIYIVVKNGISLRMPVLSHIKNEYIPSGSRATTLSMLSMIDSAFDVLIFTMLGFVSNLGLSAIFIGSAVIVFIGLLFPIKEKMKGRRFVNG